MKAEDFAKRLFDSKDEMLPKGTDAETCLDILAEHFLGDERIVYGYPASASQWNSEVTYAILKKYPSGAIRRIPKEKKIG